MSLRTILVTLFLIWYWLMSGMKPLGLLCVYFLWLMMLSDDKIKADQKRKADEEFQKWKDDHDRKFKKGKYAVSSSQNGNTENQELRKKAEQLQTLEDKSPAEGYEHLAKLAVSQMEQEISGDKEKRK